MVGRMTPQYPDIDKPPLDVEVQAVIDPRYYVGREKGGERTMLLLFSEAHGWLTYALPEASALKIALQLQATALHQEISQQRHGAA